MPRKKKPLKKLKKTLVKKSRRSQLKFPALEKKYNLLSRQELIEDFDYLHKLNDKEKEWLNKFVSEEINADFRHPNPLNKTKKQRRVCYTANNRRNRCVWTKSKISGRAMSINEVSVKEESQLNPEELMIRDEEKRLEEKLTKFDNSFYRADKRK